MNFYGVQTARAGAVPAAARQEPGRSWGWYHRLTVKGRRCHGFTLWRGKRRQVELWICPRNFSVGAHTHEEMDGHIVLLLGQVHLCKVVDGKERATDRHFVPLSVPRGVVHYFVPKKRHWSPTVFLNFERWTTAPTSAAVDFKSA